MDRSAAPTPVAGAHQGSAEGSVWVLVGGFLVIVVRVVVPDRRLMVLIHVMVCALLLRHQKRFAGTIRPNQCLRLGHLALTRTWVRENRVSLCRGRCRQTQNLCRRALVLDPNSVLVAARHAAVQECMDGLPLG